MFVILQRMNSGNCKARLDGSNMKIKAQWFEGENYWPKTEIR